MSSLPEDLTDALDTVLNQARTCLKRELACPRAESTPIAVGALPTPSGMLAQRYGAHRLLEHFDGDTALLLALAHTCRSRAADSAAPAQDRLLALRAADLCEQAAALITLSAGPDPTARSQVARRLLERGFSDAPAPRYRVVWTLTLPAPEGITDRFCMAPPTRAKVLFAQAFPRRSAADCCWHHEGDWHRASRAAVRLAAAIGAAGLPGDADVVERFVQARLQEWGVGGWQAQAARSLVVPDRAIVLIDTDRPGVRAHHDGRHRTHAMLTAGVRRTVVLAG